MRSLIALGMRREVAKRIIRLIRETDNWEQLPIPYQTAERFVKLDPDYFNPDYSRVEPLFPLVPGLEDMPTLVDIRAAIKACSARTTFREIAPQIEISNTFLSRFLQARVGVSLDLGCMMIVYLREAGHGGSILETSA